MSGLRKTHTQVSTSVALAWTFFEADDFDIKRIAIFFGVAPTTSENITVTLDSGQGAAYDTVLRTVDPAGSTSVVFEDIDGLNAGDKVIVAYANTDTRAITGTAVVEL
jgi:hypothetical protein